MTRLLPQRGLWLVTLAMGLAGCTSAPRPQPPEEPFVFRALDLRQRDALGAPAWQLISPEARYDIVRQLAQARQPRGTIYKQGKPHITVRALSGTVIGDGTTVIEGITNFENPLKGHISFVQDEKGFKTLGGP